MCISYIKGTSEHIPGLLKEIMHIYHSETNQQHGIPLHILQRQPVPTQRAGLYEIPCSVIKFT